MVVLQVVPARMMKSHPKMNTLECLQHFSHYKPMEFFPIIQGQLLGRPWFDLAEFEPIQAFIAVLATCKYKDNPIKNEGARVLIALYISFSDTQGG